jgi:hypothetical protein
MGNIFKAWGLDDWFGQLVFSIEIATLHFLERFGFDCHIVPIHTGGVGIKLYSMRGI